MKKETLYLQVQIPIYCIAVDRLSGQCTDDGSTLSRSCFHQRASSDKGGHRAQRGNPNPGILSFQVNAIARGQLPDAGCTSIADVSQSRTGNRVNVTLTTTVDPNAMCAQVIMPFEYVISLDVSSLLPAQYIVNVNGVEATFELSSTQPTQTPWPITRKVERMQP